MSEVRIVFRASGGRRGGVLVSGGERLSRSPSVRGG